MTPSTLTPATLRAHRYHEARQHHEDTGSQIEPSAELMTTERTRQYITALQYELAVAYELLEAAAQIEICEARLGMLADASYSPDIAQ